jgi:hypothetical protein
VIVGTLEIVSLWIDRETEDESAAQDYSAHRRVLTTAAFRSVGADCKGKDENAISKEEICP